MTLHFEHELVELKEQLLTMASHAEMAVTTAVKAVIERDDDLARVARNFSRQMARERFFSHSDRDGKTVIQRAAKVSWSKIGENLFMCDGMDDFTAFSVRGWMRSLTHRQNILDREWTDTGIGVYRTPDDRVYVTQVFVRR